MDPQMDSSPDSKPPSTKTPVVRGARACTVCRAAKMKCVGAEDGQKQCQRCKRANVECVFEKHRRGRKPGSKLSEASKMLRRLEKGLNASKMKSQSTEATSPYHTDDLRIPSSQDNYATSRSSEQAYSSTTSHFPTNELPPPMKPYHQSPDTYLASSNVPRNLPMEEDDEDIEQNDEAFFPMKLIRENKRNSFFRTILNPDTEPTEPPRRSTSSSPRINHSPAPVGPVDPQTSGLISEKEVLSLFDIIILRLNPFVNLFDPALHTASYVRSKCPFLFTTLLMAGCKFFMPEKYKQCQKLAHEFAVLAFAEGWKRVEVVQAFACLTYWRDPTDTRTWTYIGYACRMAVELGLHRYVPNPLPTETPMQRLERRNRERTYLVLFVHDRSLSMQTGRHWMLPEDDLVRNALTWHEMSGSATRPEDVVIAAFVSLRRIAAETTEIFNSAKGHMGIPNTDINYDHVLANCNVRLTQWDSTWRQEMQKARGEQFHFQFLSFFRLHVRLFLNSFGLHASLLPNSRQPPSLQALTVCCTSALDSLTIVSHDFDNMKLLRYAQDSITVMSAYSAVFLLKLLRTPNTGDQLAPETANKIHTAISQTADSYEKASQLFSPSVHMSTSYHARFLRSLVENDIFKTRRGERERFDNSMPIDPRLQGPATSNAHGPLQSAAAPQAYSQQVHRMHEQQSQPQPQHQHQQQMSAFNFPSSPNLPPHPNEYQSEMIQTRNNMTNGQAVAHVQYPGTYIPSAAHHSEQDAQYWRNMFVELGFGENDAPMAMHGIFPNNNVPRPMANTYMEQQQQQHQQQQQQQQHQQLSHVQHNMHQQQGQMQYQAMHVSPTTTYGH